MLRLLAPLLTALALLASFAPAAQAQARDTGYLLRHDYQYFLDEGFHGDLYPTHAEAALIAGQVHYRAVFAPAPAGVRGYQLRTGRDDSAFAALNQQYMAQGYRLVHHQRILVGRQAINQGIWYR